MSDKTPKDGEPGWFERKGNIDKVWYVLLAFGAILTASEFLYEHHPHFAI